MEISTDLFVVVVVPQVLISALCKKEWWYLPSELSKSEGKLNPSNISSDSCQRQSVESDDLWRTILDPGFCI